MTGHAIVVPAFFSETNGRSVFVLIIVVTNLVAVVKKDSCINFLPALKKLAVSSQYLAGTLGSRSHLSAHSYFRLRSCSASGTTDFSSEYPSTIAPLSSCRWLPSASRQHGSHCSWNKEGSPTGSLQVLRLQPMPPTNRCVTATVRIAHSECRTISKLCGRETHDAAGNNGRPCCFPICIYARPGTLQDGFA